MDTPPTAPYAAPRSRVADVDSPSPKSRLPWFLLAISTAIGALLFLGWAVQTAWLGSFPDRDIDLYPRWALIQFSLFVLCLIVCIFATIRLFWRRR